MTQRAALWGACAAGGGGAEDTQGRLLESPRWNNLIKGQTVVRAKRPYVGSSVLGTDAGAVPRGSVFPVCKSAEGDGLKYTSVSASQGAC